MSDNKIQVSSIIFEGLKRQFEIKEEKGTMKISPIKLNYEDLYNYIYSQTNKIKAFNEVSNLEDKIKKINKEDIILINHNSAI